jgi:GTP-binding protein EngB required for normal cell division
VIGKTGVGKSSLINQAFGVEEALTSHDRPGDANIDTEFISEQNDRFVLHDSKGFEPGEEDNVKIVQDFIQHRRSEPALKDQLHAVWLCFEIPRAGGRLLETGTEAFLTLKRDGKLGNIPVVVVLTKYDMLLDRVERTLDNSSLKRSGQDALKKLVKKKADAELKDICIRPLQKFAGRHIPHATISTKGHHKETLASLLQMTENLVRQHFAPEASVMTSIAQRVDPKLKINASIEVGKRRYWKVLASSAAFKNRVVRDCLNVLHTDIVAVWNFHDSHRYLHSKEFRTLIVNMVDKLDDEPANPSQTIAIGLPIVGTIAGIMSALAGPAAPIVVPIAASIVLALWVRDVYQTSHTVLRRFMCYLIDLTLVLQTLYLISESHELSRRAIKLAVASYLASPMSGEVHTKIHEYDKGLTFLEHADRDTLDKIIELMQFYSIGAERISELRAQIPAVGLFPDEPWEV